MNDKIFKCVSLFLLGVSCAIVLTLCFQIRRTEAELRSMREKMTNLRIINQSTLQICKSMIDLNCNCNNVDLVYNLLLSAFPVSATSDQSIYVLSSNNGCSACLTFLLEQLSDLDYGEGNVYIVLENKNVHIMDELKAQGYEHLNICGDVFPLFSVSSEINLVLAKPYNGKLMLMGYDINTDKSLLLKFLCYE